jgi:drug/metabolite transporter (DMT)-like permease
MALRYLIAASIFLLISRKLILDRNILVVSSLLSASTLFWIFGLKFVSPGDSAVLSYSMPLFAIPMATLILGEKPILRELVGAIVGFLGVGLYSLTLSHGSLLIGDIYTIINAVFWAGFSTFYRKMKDEDPLSLLGTQFLIGSIPLLLGSIFYPQVSFTENFFFDLAYLSIISGVFQFVLWNAMLKVERVGRVTTMAFAVPATTVAIQSIETVTLPSLVSIIGASLMFLGIFISNNRSILGKSGSRTNTS